jgi:hypothetical protein
MAASEDVSLPDLQVIQRYSLAVRGATARRADVIEALRADLEWLTGSGRTTRPAASAASQPPAAAPAPARKAPATKAPATKTHATKAPATKTPATRAAAKKAPARKAAAKTTKSGARRG